MDPIERDNDAVRQSQKARIQDRLKKKEAVLMNKRCYAGRSDIKEVEANSLRLRYMSV